MIKFAIVTFVLTLILSYVVLGRIKAQTVSPSPVVPSGAPATGKG